MNFFEHQDQARRNTHQLVGLFVLAVSSIILLLYLVVVMLFGSGRMLNPSLFGMVAVPTLLLIGAGSVYKILQLKAGGAVIAQEMGGRLLSLDTADVQERQLLNIVEEMAIASGISVPAVYLLEREQGINAFAAGFTPNDAVIGVTRGCLEVLSRDELQGVIGHEFSHILNGDMRLNLNLIGVLNGILLIYIVGRVLLDYGSRGRSRDKQDNTALFGLALIAIGLVGVFFGRLIKAAVSRQREFLADASAVQFTRNPQGIAGALRKISQHQYSAILDSPHAEENSHLFFGNALRLNFWGEMFATHPPLSQRILRLETSARAGVAAIPPDVPGEASNANALTLGLAGEGGRRNGAGSSGLKEAAQSMQQVDADAVVAQVGTVNPAHYAYARALVAQLPEALQQGIRTRSPAIAIVYSLFLDTPESEIRSKQLEWLKQVETPDILNWMTELMPAVDGLEARARLPLLDLTIPALRQSSASDCQQLFKVVQGLVRVDGQWSLTEFTLQVVLWHRLQPCISPNLALPIKFETLEPLWNDCLVVLSVLAQVGETNPAAIAYAFRTGLFRLPGAAQKSLPDHPVPCTVTDLKKSLENLRVAAPKVKQAMVDACAHTVLLDNVVKVQEADLLRAIAITLDCPLPPFLNVGSMAHGTTPLARRKPT